MACQYAKPLIGTARSGLLTTLFNQRPAVHIAARYYIRPRRKVQLMADFGQLKVEQDFLESRLGR